ncbi:MAG: thiamine pyrophosphate-dependent dehydrogenase E1 component subunit alpha [Nitrospinae bacterium]|nr:thiamine pyrophosphate-dependent dehydrogenase E1 component subunit alpha [Nitrospinota bacterium]
MLRVEKETAQKLYYTMVRIRRFEERVMQLFQEGRLPGFLHVSIGQEAVPSGVCAHLRQNDYISSTHRGHGHVIAKGARLDRMMAELYGKTTGYCKGKGGSMHIADLDLGILGANGIVGAGIPIAAGTALAFRMRRTDQVVACFFGDGGANTGAFHEGLNLASVWNLPVVFVCENNQFAESTPQRVHQKIKDISVRALAYDIPGETVDGMDVLEVYRVAGEAIARARAGGGPTLVECKTYRFYGHYVGDPGTAYRTPEEVEEWKQRDPIPTFAQRLLAEGAATEADLQGAREAVQRELEEAIQFAEASPDPDVRDALEDIYV